MASSWRSVVKRIFEYPILEKDEERELFFRWKNEEDKEAREKLINSHLRLVLKLACKYSNREETIIELFYSGLSGLIRVVDRDGEKRFDPDRGRLATYAWYEICGEITSTFEKWQRKKRRYDVLSPSAPTISADTPLRGEWSGSRITILDTLPSGEGATGHEVEDIAIRKLDQQRALDVVHYVTEEILSPRDQTIFQGRLDDEETMLKVFSERFGVTTQRISEIQARSLEKVKLRIQIKHQDIWKVMASSGI